MSDQTEMDQKVADYLRSTGRDDLADSLDGVIPEPEPVESEGEKFLREIREAQDRGKVSVPGLLAE